MKVSNVDTEDLIPISSANYTDIYLSVCLHETRKCFRFIVNWKTTDDTLTQVIHFTICPNNFFFLTIILTGISIWNYMLQ